VVQFDRRALQRDVQPGFDEFGFGAENYANDELNGNNEFKSIFMIGSG